MKKVFWKSLALFYIELVLPALIVAGILYSLIWSIHAYGAIAAGISICVFSLLLALPPAVNNALRKQGIAELEEIDRRLAQRDAQLAED